MDTKETVLVVDDDREIVGAIALALEKEGYRVLRAYDGMEALDHALDPELRLILMDVMMPRLDGLSAVLRIRERRNLPIIVLSAKSEESDKVLGLSMGADDYVTKPFSTQELVARVRSQLRRYTRLGDVNASARDRRIVGQPGPDGGRGRGEAHRNGAGHPGPADVQLGPGLSCGGDLPPGLGGGGLRLGEHSDGAHPPDQGEDRAQPSGAGLFEGGVGNWL